LAQSCSPFIPHYVGREFSRIQKYGYFPLELLPKLGTSSIVCFFATACQPSQVLSTQFTTLSMHFCVHDGCNTECSMGSSVITELLVTRKTGFFLALAVSILMMMLHLVSKTCFSYCSKVLCWETMPILRNTRKAG